MSDKEITVELVKAFVTSWNAAQGTSKVSQDEYIDLIQSVHEAVINLPYSAN